MEEALRDVVTRLGNGREVLRMTSKLHDGREVIECSDGTRIVVHSGGEDWADWVDSPNRFRQELNFLHGMAADALQMAAVLSDKAMNDDVSKKIEAKVPHMVANYDALRNAIAEAAVSLKRARGAMFVITGIITEIDDAPVE